MVVRTSLVVLSILLPFGSLCADIAVPGRRTVWAEVTVDFGELAGRCYSVVTVTEGDTLSGLAEEHLGDGKRWKEIQEQNPGLDPERLKPGQRVVLPPRQKGSGGERYWVYQMTGFSAGLDQLDLVGDGERLRGPYATRLLLVPERSRQAVEKLQRAGRRSLPKPDELDPKLGTALSEPVAIRHSLPEASATHRIRTKVRLKGIEKGTLVCELGTQHYDDDGEPVDEDQRQASLLPLFGVSVIGLIAIALLGRARRRKVASA